MPEHLLSIFPLPENTAAYARLTCICIWDADLGPVAPLLYDRIALERVLTDADLPGSAQEILATLDDGLPIQMAVHGSTARKIGFRS